MTDLDYLPMQPARFKWGRVVSLAGAAGLCVSFFMEQGVIVPFEWCIESVDVMVSFCLPFTAAILLLPLLAFRAVPRVDGAAGVGKFLAVAVCAICLSTVTIGLGWLILFFYTQVQHSSIASMMRVVHAVTAVMVVSLVLAIVATVRSRLPRKAAAAQFALGASCLAYFAFFAIEGFSIHANAGLWLSLAASGMLAVGSAIDWFQCRPAREHRTLSNGPEIEPRGMDS